MKLNLTPGILFSAILAALASPSLAGEAPPMLLASVERGQSAVSQYLVSEKLDGVRAFWDGQSLRTRQGNVINAPAWFTQGFPAQPLDGELWVGRGQFERVSATVRRRVPDDAEWREVRYQVFELPDAAGTFRERVQALQSLVAAAAVPWLQAVDQFEVSSRAALDRKLDEITRAGGEGLMLHRADAPYLTGRSDVLLKMKRWNDAEATVVGHRPGKGKFAGMLGALQMRTADGTEFLLGTGLDEALRRNPPPVGTLVTYRYRELTEQGRPRFASFYRIQEF